MLSLADLYTATEPCPHCGGKGHVRAVPKQRIVELRQQAGLSILETARRMELSESFYRQLEAGHRRMTEERAWDFIAVIDAAIAAKGGAS